MSDPSNNLTLQKQIDLLEKALIRERNAKKTLEEKLEHKVQEEFDQNKELLFALESANTRQIQLQFLSTLTEELLSDKALDDMVDHFIKKLSTLMERCSAVQVLLKSNESSSITLFNGKEQQWSTLPWLEDYQSPIKNMLKEAEFCWHRIDYNDETPSPFEFLQKSTSLFLVINVSKLQQCLIILDINHYCYGKDFKETLNTAGKQFSLAIKRHNAKVELSYNYQVLKSVIADLESTQRQLAQNEKMASLGQLSAGIAHEINNPIGYISSNLDTLIEYINTYEKTFSELTVNNFQAKLADDELVYIRDDVQDLTSSCIDGINRISDIVNSLKTFSRKEDDKYKELDINDVIESSLKIVWNQLKYKHQIEKTLLIPSPLILANNGQLQQVFVNLFINAAHAMAENGQLTITSKVVDKLLHVNVQDTGCGMDEKVIRRLFEPFYTTKQEDEGTGLGLSVSYAIIEKHNATVEVLSTKGEGSTFILKFPILTRGY